MGRMSERAALIENLENMVGDYRAGKAEDLETVLDALRNLRPDLEILAMPEAKRCPIVAELMGTPFDQGKPVGEV